nr:MAG TPA: hypothetical protein [Caudoviricetes sp.]
MQLLSYPILRPRQRLALQQASRQAPPVSPFPDPGSLRHVLA